MAKKKIQEAHTIGDLIKILSEFAPDMRIVMPEGSRDFGIDIRESDIWLYAVEIGDKEQWED